MSNQHIPPPDPNNWDSLLDNPFNIGPFERSFQVDGWLVITGAHVRLPDALPPSPYSPNSNPQRRGKLLVVASTISVGISGAREMDLNYWSEVLLIGVRVNQHNGCAFTRYLWGKADVMRIGIISGTSNHFSPSTSRWIVKPVNRGFGMRREYHFDANRGFLELYAREHNPDQPWIHAIRRAAVPDWGPAFDACQPFLERLLVTAQSRFNANEPDDAILLLDRLETLLSLRRGVASWQELAPQIAATREIFQPQLSGSDRVPHLTPAVYGGVAEAYGPALTQFANTFQQFVDRAGDVAQRVRAARLLLNEQAGAIRFQALVIHQLTTNFSIATDAVSRAQASMESQSARVEEAEESFQRGLRSWEQQQRREAQWRIAGAVFSFVVSVGSIFKGNPNGAKAAADAVEAGGRMAKLVEMMKKIVKLVQVVAKVVEVSLKIDAALKRISNTGELAALMADARREAESGLDDAPSANAYWDQFWVEVETALDPAITAKIPGAAEFLKELKVLIIYGRAQTAAQTAIPPLMQELAQASLLAELARQQHDAIAEEIETLEAQKPVSAMAAVAFWLRHRSVQHALFTALQDFDASHRYWALTDELPERDPSRSLTDLAEDLYAIADIKVSLQRALESFNPIPQPFRRVRFNVPAEGVADFLRDGSFAVRFTPDVGPLAEWGNIGRVRVREVAAWIIWNEGKRPAEGNVDFTIQTDGDYYDQRMDKDELLAFRFLGSRVNLTFRYDPADDFVEVPAKVAEDFRAFYTEPTLFTEWQFSLPNGGGALSLDDFQGAVSGIRLEFTGTYLKDPARFFDGE